MKSSASEQGLTILSKNVCCGPISSPQKNPVSYSKRKFKYWLQRFSRKQHVSSDNVSLCETLNITPRRYTCICSTKAVILSSTSNFYATIAALCNNMRPQVKVITNVAHSNGPIRKRRLSSAGSKGHVYRL